MTTYGTVSIDSLTLPPQLDGERRYQREQRAERERHMAATYDPDLDQPLSVCAIEDGKYEVADGQNRLGMHRILGTSEVMVKFLNGGRYTTPAERARYFLALSRGTVPLRAYDNFNAAVVAGEPDAVAIEAIAREHNVLVGKRASEVAISVSGLKTIMEKAGPEVLSSALTVLHAAWPEPSQDRHNGHLIMGVAYFIREAQRTGVYNERRLISALRGHDVRRIQFEAREVAARMYIGYNTAGAWGQAIRRLARQRVEFLDW